jgi:hypothetical protein
MYELHASIYLYACMHVCINALTLIYTLMQDGKALQMVEAAAPGATVRSRASLCDLPVVIVLLGLLFQPLYAQQVYTCLCVYHTYIHAPLMSCTHAYSFELTTFY